MTVGPGIFAAIVGPSGAGKDSLIRGLAARLRETDEIVLARRVVTRISDAHEDHDTLDEPAFLAAQREGRFALSWAAHGLSYGVPIEIDSSIAQGNIVVCNVSRAIVASVRARYRRSLVILVTARPETLAMRLAARGREDQDARRDRLQRATAPEIATAPDRILDNDGVLEEASTRLYEILMSCRVDGSA